MAKPNASNAPHSLSIALAQCDIAWEASKENLFKLRDYTLQAKAEGADMVVFPEAIVSGFSMDIDKIALPPNSEELSSIKELAQKEEIAIVSSFFVREPANKGGEECGFPGLKNINGEYFHNRVILFTPQGERFCQDKRHLFRPAGEARHISSARERQIFHYQGFNILLIACYDLRFPVWCRNRANEYDLLIDVANWPVPRRMVWQTLLQARAMENLAYVCGVNRVGTDAEGLKYSGDSALIDPRGNLLAEVAPSKEGLSIGTIEKEAMENLRKKFPVWQDADTFTFTPDAPYPASV